MLNVIFSLIGLFSLITSSITDIKKREVPDYISFSTIFFSIISSAIYSITINSFEPLFICAICAVIGFLIGAFMYYTGQWGGGDAKLIIGLTCLFSQPLIFSSYQIKWFYLIIFFYGLIIFFGSIYTLTYILISTITNNKKFIKNIKIFYKKNWKKIKYTTILTLISVILAITKNYLFSTITFFLFSLIHLYFIVKITEKTNFYKQKQVNQLVEGDWVIERTYEKNNKTSFCDYYENKFIFDEDESMIQLLKETILLIFNMKNKKVKKVNEKKKIIRIILNNLEKEIGPETLKEQQQKIIKAINAKTINDFNEIIKDKKLSQTLKSYFSKKGFTYDKILITDKENLGITKEQIIKLKKNNFKTILVKEGIPFVPSFLLAYIAINILAIISKEKMIEYLILFF